MFTSTVSVLSEELTSPEPITVGTTVRTRLKSMGREYEYNWEVVEHEPPSRMTIESTSGPFPTTLVYSNLDRGFPRLKQVLESGA